jgi:hypothetical protein
MPPGPPPSARSKEITAIWDRAWNISKNNRQALRGMKSAQRRIGGQYPLPSGREGMLRTNDRMLSEHQFVSPPRG